MQKLQSVVQAKGQTALWVSSVPESKTYYEQHGFSEVMQGEIHGNTKYFMMKKLSV